MKPMIHGTMSGYLGAAPHERLLANMNGFGASPHQRLLMSNLGFTGAYTTGEIDALINETLNGYYMGAHLGLSWGDLNPVKHAKNAGKAVVKAGEAAVGAAKDVGKAIGKGAMEVGKFTAKIGGKVVDFALLPFNVMLDISMKLADLVCNKIPPQVFVAGAMAGGAAMGAPMNPQQAAMLRTAVCTTAKALKDGKITKVQDLTKPKKLLHLGTVAASQAMKIAQSQAMQGMNTGMVQGMMQQGQQQGQPPTEAEMVAAEQIESGAEIAALLDEGIAEFDKLPADANKAIEAGKKLGKQLMSKKFRPALQQAAGEMVGDAAAGVAAAASEKITDMKPKGWPGVPAGLPGLMKNPKHAIGKKVAEAVEKAAGINTGAKTRQAKADPTAARLRAEIKQFKILGRNDLAAKVQARLSAHLSATGNLSGYNFGASPTQKWTYGLLIAGSVALAGAGAYAAARR